MILHLDQVEREVKELNRNPQFKRDGLQFSLFLHDLQLAKCFKKCLGRDLFRLKKSCGSHT